MINTDIVLERLRAAVARRTTRELLGHVDLDLSTDHLAEDLVARLRSTVLARKLDDITIEYPADWLEALKDRWAPEWLRRRWPVRRTCHAIKIYDTYPALSIPDGGEPVRVVVRRGDTC